MAKMIGILQSAERKVTQGGKSYVVAAVNGVRLSAWEGMAESVMNVPVGRNVEVEYATNAKGFHNLVGIALQADGVPATLPPAPAPGSFQSKPRTGGGGKSPQERDEIAKLSIGHDVSSLLSTLGGRPDWGAYVDGAWEQEAKAYCAMCDYIFNEWQVSHKDKVS